MTDVAKGFHLYYVNNYTSTKTFFWGESVNDDGTFKMFNMTLPQDTTIDLNLAFYDYRMYGSCASTHYS